MNCCQFSDDRKYRYVLKHICIHEDIEMPIVWIGLNPSTADEKHLDPTLTKIEKFSMMYGFNCFYMLNLFAYRATNPEEMKKQKNPIGPENDHWIKEICQKTNYIMCCWGANGFYLNRSRNVLNYIYCLYNKLYCLDLTKNNEPVHPLYIPYTMRIKALIYNQKEKSIVMKENTDLSQKYKNDQNLIKW